MANIVIKKSTLPVLGKGKAGEPKVTLASKGQISFSPSASKVFDNRTLALVMWDKDSRTMTVRAFTKPPKDYTEADCFVIGYQKKSKAAYFSASALLQNKEAAIGYDYKASGNQSFNVTAVNTDKEKSVSWQLPEGAMTPKPSTPRKKKNKTEAPANTAPAPVETAKAAAAGSLTLVEE